jgi:DNA-binding FadR family transcriptional regulator
LRYLAIARALRAEILGGRYPVGSRLPGEVELAGMLGVARTSVREALRVLASEGLVRTTRGQSGGSVVCAVDHRDVMTMLRGDIEALATFQGCTEEEMEETQELLEVTAAWMAAQRRTPLHLSALRACISDLAPGVQPGAAEVDANLGFHYRLLEATGNRMLHLFAEPVSAVIHHRFRQREHDPAYYQQVTEDHRRIADAVEARDARLARDEMLRHLRNLRSDGDHGARSFLTGLAFE